uniref:Uncharacterized protein n=1 Tax=Wuchereria bancrofti TaxID=6293 RepID=A0AAF5RWC7_WUCBA
MATENIALVKYMVEPFYFLNMPLDRIKKYCSTVTLEDTTRNPSLRVQKETLPLSAGFVRQKE